MKGGAGGLNGIYLHSEKYHSYTKILMQQVRIRFGLDALSKRVLFLENGDSKLDVTGFPFSNKDKIFNENVNPIPIKKIIYFR